MSTATAVQPRASLAAKFTNIPTLDGWRGIAILFVLADHFLKVTGLGQHGVAVFFVLSGFLITDKLLGEKEQTGTINLRRFYIRRSFRLWPAAWLFLLFIAFVSRFGTFSTGFELFACLAFFRNFVDQTGKHIFTSHFWSLSIEEQFYLFWPCIVLLLRSSRATVIAAVLAIAIAATRLTHWQALLTSPMEATFGTQFRADSLFVGCIAALNRDRLESLKGWTVYPLLAAFILCCFNYHKLIPLYESCIIGALIMATAQTPDGTVAHLLESASLKKVGMLSYSLYVWHQPFWVTASIFGRPALLTIVLFIVATGLGLLSYYYVEKPLRAIGKRLASEDLSSKSPVYPVTTDN